MLLMVVAHHTDPLEGDIETGGTRLALQGPHHSHESGDRGKSVRQRTGNGIGVLHVDTRQGE